MTKCFFQAPHGPIRWLGIFVHSEGDRLLFFPGFSELPANVVGYNDRVLRWDQAFLIDHLSLEQDRRSWHFTAPQSSDHLGNLNTRTLGNDRIHWFSLSAATEEILRLVREETRVVALNPPQDVDRRASVFRQAREEVTFQLLQLNADYQAPPEPNFLHFSVVIGPLGFASPDAQLFGDPRGGPFAGVAAIDCSTQVPVRLHRVQVSETLEAEITTMNLHGKLDVPVVFSSALPESSKP
jgi:hypothetical protein